MAERQAKDERIDLRVPKGFPSKTKLAAALMGVSASEFMRRAILRALSETLGDKDAAPSPHTR